jgi:hypothetical protein
MLSFHAQLKVFLATAPCDLRMNFNGLWAAAQERLGEDPKGGALFVFGNPLTHRHRDRWPARWAVKESRDRVLTALTDSGFNRLRHASRY